MNDEKTESKRISEKRMEYTHTRSFFKKIKKLTNERIRAEKIGKMWLAHTRGLTQSKSKRAHIQCTRDHIDRFVGENQSQTVKQQKAHTHTHIINIQSS